MHIIKEIAKNANIGIDAIDSIKTSVKDEELKQVILSQRARLCDIKDKAVAELEGDDRDVDANFFEKTMLRGAIKMNTLLDKSNRNIAQMLIEGNNMGINDLTGIINEMEEDGEQVPELAHELINTYQSDVSTLRRFL